MMLNRKYILNIDWVTLIIYVCLLIVGFLSIHSATYDPELPYDFGQKSVMQLMWMFISISCGIVILFRRVEFFFKLAPVFYAIMMLIAFLLIFIGKEVNGAKSWLSFGSIAIQPAEFGKVATALMLARVFSDNDIVASRYKGLLHASVIMAIPMMLIILQNDTGSALVFGGFVIVLYINGMNRWFYILSGASIFLFISGLVVQQQYLIWFLFSTFMLIQAYVNKNFYFTVKYLASIALFNIVLALCDWWFEWNIHQYILAHISIVASFPYILYYAFSNKLKTIFYTIFYYICSLCYVWIIGYLFENVLKIYQRKRILDMVGLELDPRGWGYNVNQSMIAIGSGGFAGKGYMKGTQTKFDFVPEQSTDFIFCTIGEEGGFIFSFLLLSLFTLLVFRLLRIANRVNDHFAKNYTYCAVAVLTVHVMINISMTIGLMPVIGIPLPFISYGGSSLLAFSILIFIAVRLCGVYEKEARF